MPTETVFTLEATPVKFGRHASEDAGWEMRRLGARHVLLVADPKMAELGHTGRIQRQLEEVGIEVTVYNGVRVEPTLDSFEAAGQAARAAGVDGFVALGGGSTIDTAKVANLLHTHGGQVMDYVNPPVGAGKKPPSPLRPLLAIPTTSGSGSEATTVAVLDLPELRVKTGISHRYLRPSQAIVDPELTRTAPAHVTASAGLDVVCHAAESYLSRPFDERERPATPDDRPPYQGSNPVADIWSGKALEFGGRYLRRAVRDPDDLEARGQMMLSATMAGVGFGSAGVHIPHACAYPVAGLRHEYRAPGYDSAFVPHGYSVIVTAPAAFRFTFAAMPERHAQVTAWLTGHPLAPPDPEALPNALMSLMRDLGAPRGLRELGYSEADIPRLVEGALKQQRLLVLAPRTPSADDLAQILRDSLDHW